MIISIPAAERLKAVPPPKWTLTPSRCGVVSSKQPPLKRSAPCPRHVSAFTRGNDLPRNPQTLFSWQGARCPLKHSAYWAGQRHWHRTAGSSHGRRTARPQGTAACGRLKPISVTVGDITQLYTYTPTLRAQRSMAPERRARYATGRSRSSAAAMTVPGS